MIDRQNGKIVIECDSCDEVFEGSSGEWGEVWPIARRDGWTSQPISSDWVHSCPKCGRKR